MVVIYSILYPVIFVLDFVLSSLHRLTGSWGGAIILTNLAVSIAMIPLSRMARKAERREQDRQRTLEPLVHNATVRFRGRERFEHIESIYTEYNYHPIKSLAALGPLLIQLPFLIGALLLLTNYPPLIAESFLFIGNLGAPDKLLPIPGTSYSVNLLPFILTGVGVAESQTDNCSTGQSRRRYFVISCVIFLLIYGLPAAVCLYWLTGNIFSFVSSKMPSRSR